MKKLFRNVLMLSAMAGTVLFTACDGEGDEVLLDPPSVTVTTDPADAEVEVGEPISFTANVIAPAGFNTIRIVSIESPEAVVTLDNYQSEYTRNDLGLDAGVTDATVPFEPFSIPAAGVFTVELLAVDDENQSTTFTFDIVVTDPSVNSYSTVLIGGFLNNTLGSFYDAVEDSVYAFSSIEDNAVNQSQIDLVYYYVVGADAVNAVIASPDNSEAGITWNTQTSSNTWPFTAASNSTRFKQAAVGTVFADLDTNSELEAAFPEVGAEADRITNLQEGALIAFRTDDSKGARYGVYQVVSIEGTQGSERRINLNVKSQSIDNL